MKKKVDKSDKITFTVDSYDDAYVLHTSLKDKIITYPKNNEGRQELETYLEKVLGKKVDLSDL